MFDTVFIYDGIWEGYICDGCGRERKKLHTFIIPYKGDMSNLTQVAKYGSSCIKKIDIKEEV